jgi:hypothetical protein
MALIKALTEWSQSNHDHHRNDRVTGAEGPGHEDMKLAQKYSLGSGMVERAVGTLLRSYHATPIS